MGKKIEEPRTLEILTGEVRFERRYYRKLTATGGYVYSHLPDEILGIAKGKNLSPGLAEIAASLAAENSYRKSSDFLKSMLDVSMSHETGIDGTGDKEVTLLVIGADGANIKRQQRGKPKKTREDGKTFKIKTAVIYEGWEETTRGKYKLKNPMYYVHSGEGKEFWQALERHLGRIYSLEGCQRIIVGGDGATWIRQGAKGIGAEYQYCRFHLERDIRKLFREMPEVKESLKKTMEKNDLDGFNMIMDALLVQDEPKPKEKPEDFRKLINNVWEGIIGWLERNKPKPVVWG